MKNILRLRSLQEGPLPPWPLAMDRALIMVQRKTECKMMLMTVRLIYSGRDVIDEEGHDDHGLDEENHDDGWV